MVEGVGDYKEYVVEEQERYYKKDLIGLKSSAMN